MTVESWLTESVADCLVPVSVAGKTKIQSRDYKPSGRFPVIDQGQEQIAGWTDDESAVIDAPLPLVVFGDHTRIFKYLDTPFARGADGTQLLRPKDGIDPLFFFYACRAIDLPARGYNRHFTILKEKELTYPLDTTEQKVIAYVLRKVESALQQQTALLDNLQELKRAVMRELFTRGLRGEPQKDTEIGPVPESWVVKPIAEVFEIVQGISLKRNLSDNADGIPFLRTSNVYWGRLDLTNLSRIHLQPDAIGNRWLKRGDLLVCEGGEIGRAAVWELDDEGYTYQNHLHRLRPLMADMIDAKFAAAWLEVGFVQRKVYEGAGNKTTIPNLSRARLAELLMPLPPLDEQHEIVTILDAIDRKIDLHRQKRAVLEELFKALLHKLMTGEIRVADLDLSALNAHPAMQGQQAEAAV
jgi:type I restriction enzyme S subunit